MTLRTLNYGNYGIFLIKGHAVFWFKFGVGQSFQDFVSSTLRTFS